MSQLPKYIMRNCTIFVDRESKIGQASEITLPSPEVMTEEVRNAGMHMAIDVNLGITKPEASFKMTSFDPQVLALYGIAPGNLKDFLITGALGDEDGTVHAAQCFMKAFLQKFDAGSWKPGDLSEVDCALSIFSYKINVDDATIVDVNPFDVSIGGVSQTAAISRALGIF